MVLRHRLCLFVGSLSSHSDALCLRSYAQMFLPFRGHSYARCAHIFMLSRSNAIMFPIRLLKVNFHRRLVIHDTSSLLWSSPRPISDSQLHVLPHFHLCPIYLVVFKGVYFIRMGYLILRGASRLDAFSVYPFQTWLPCYAIGMTTDTPAVRPARSSRTKASSFQISYARAG